MKERTDEQVERMKKHFAKRMGKLHLSYGEITCNDCDVVRRCEHAYDLYNTDGDCLAMK